MKQKDKKDTSYYMNRISSLFKQAISSGIKVNVKLNTDGITIYFKSDDGNGSTIELSGMKITELEGGVSNE